MNLDQAAGLRKPFDEKVIGKLPRITCRACREAKGIGNCGEHRKAKCNVCGNYLTTAHLHLDYVGHAEITDRLLQVDPEWTWEPVSFGQDGLPQMGHGGLWIRLTVCGVTRLGFGHADGKSGPDAVKECIGDAVRNAAMRFGVALDLWGATFKGEDEHDEPEQVAAPEPPVDTPRRGLVTQVQHKQMHALWRELGYDGDENRDQRLKIMTKILELNEPLETSANLGFQQANDVIEALKKRKRDQAKGAA